MRRLWLCLLVLSACAFSQRISRRVDDTQRTTVTGSRHPRAQAQFDIGPLAPGRKIGPVILGLRRTPAQQAALDHLLDEQRDPSSPNFHKWLTPEQFAARFGLGDRDMASISSWLQSHGLKIDHRARGGNWIGFSGTAAQVEAAMGTRLDRYSTGSEEHFANATEISVPEAIAPLVASVIGLNDFGPKPQHTTGSAHSLAPDDLAAIYDIMPLYDSGIDGSGQKIAVVGQSALEPGLSDINAFRAMFHLPGGDPQIVLYGSDPGMTGSLTEADLDIEWVQAIARGASLVYVYSNDFDVSTIYAIDQNVAPVISASYSGCEKEQAFDGILMQSMIQQANAQGITFIAGSGDGGPSACDDFSFEPVAANGLDIGFPASIPEATAVGGTKFDEAGGSYWNSSNTDNGASALGYIPEQAWNDTAAEGALAATTGGPSLLYSKPAWQTGPGVPGDAMRDSPDVALAASAVHDGYMTCTGGNCFRVFGGTSAAAPVFAGIITLLNQSLVTRGVLSQPGLGNINPMLYRLAQTHPDAFHDVTSGDNLVPCAIGTPDCSNGTLGYRAGPGYDLATGLGSVDAANLVNDWDMSGAQTVLSATADATAVTLSDAIHLNITVNSQNGSGAPAGMVFVNQSGTTVPSGSQPGEVLLGAAALSPSGDQSTATVTIYPGQLTTGADTISIVYGGDANFNGSSASVAVNVTVPQGHSAVVATAYSNYYVFPYPPAFHDPAFTDGAGYGIIVRLREAAGVATTLTTFTVSGTTAGVIDGSARISAFFGGNSLPAHATLIGSLALNAPSAPETVIITVGGQDASGFQWTTQIPIPLVAGPQQFDVINSGGGLVNGASYRHAYAPGMILSVFGINLTDPYPSKGQAQSLPLPLSLAGSSATVNGIPAPYYYASPNQVNIQIPYETAPGTAVLAIQGLFGQSFNYTFQVQPAAPGIFAGPGNTLVPFSSGLRGGTYTLFMTGDGALSPPLATGATPSPDTLLDQLPKPNLPVTMTIGGAQADIAFIGVPSGLAGTTQINFTVPPDAPVGAQPVVVRVGGAASQPVTFTVNP